MNATGRIFAAALVTILFLGCDRDSATKPAAAPGQKRTASRRPPPTTAPVADKDVEGKVVEIVAMQMGVKAAEVKRATNLKRDLKADELDSVELVMGLEDAFGISITDEEAEKFQTVGDLIDYVRSRRKTPG